jgi:hypothetical protein
MGWLFVESASAGIFENKPGHFLENVAVVNMAVVLSLMYKCFTITNDYNNSFFYSYMFRLTILAIIRESRSQSFVAHGMSMNGDMYIYYLQQ